MEPQSLANRLASAFFLACTLLACYHMRIGSAASAANEYFAPIVEGDEYIFVGTPVKLRRDYTGILAIDMTLAFFVAAFLPGAAGWDPAFQLLQAYLLLSFLAVITIWSIEAGRNSSRGRAIGYTGLWSVFYQTVGGAVIVPLWYMTYVLSEKIELSGTSSSERISIDKARALLPALLLGYALPTVLVYWPFTSIDTTQSFVALWQVAPVLVNVLWFLFARFFSLTHLPTDTTDDLPHIQRTLLMSGLVTAISHLSIALLYIFQYDNHIIFASSLGFCFCALYKLAQNGTTPIGLSKLLIGLPVATLVLGPGATICAMWYIREAAMRAHQPDGKKLL